MPGVYILYRKVKVWGMLPLVQGGYFDQPYWLTKQLEACHKADKETSQHGSTD